MRQPHDATSPRCRRCSGTRSSPRWSRSAPRPRASTIGDRVVLNPWLSCVPRGVSPICPACEAGELSLCWNFTAAADRARHPHRHVEGRERRLRDAHARAPDDAVPGSRQPLRRGGGVRRSVRGVAARDHATPTAAGRQGARLRRRRARHVRGRDPAVRSTPTSRSASSPASRRRRELARKLGAERGLPRTRPSKEIDRGGRRVVGRRPPRRPRPADGVPRRDRRGVRHHLEAGDASRRRCAC